MEGPISILQGPQGAHPRLKRAQEVKWEGAHFTMGSSMANFTPFIKALAALLRIDKGKPNDENAELAQGQRTNN